MNLKQKLFLTAALSLTTLVGSGQTRTNNAKNDRQTNKTEQSVNQSVTVGAPEELIKIIPGDKNTGFPRIVDVDISKELGLEPGSKIARYFNDSNKPGEFLSQAGPFHPSDNINDEDYIEKLNKAAKETYKKVNLFLSNNKNAFDEAFTENNVTEIDYKRQQITFSFDKNMTINLTENTVCETVWSDMRAGFIPAPGYSPKNLNETNEQFRTKCIKQVMDILAIGAKSGNNYVTKPSQFKP